MAIPLDGIRAHAKAESERLEKELQKLKGKPLAAPIKEQNYFSCSINGKKYMLTYSTIKNTDFYVVLVIPFSYINKEASEIGIYLVLGSIICLIVAFILACAIAKTISARLENIVSVMTCAQNGNLTVSVNEKGNDEISNVGSHFNSMIATIRGLVSRVNDSGQKVLADSAQVDAATNNAKEMADQISTTMEDLGVSVTEQAGDIENVVYHVSELAEKISAVSANVETVLEIVSSTKELSENIISDVTQLSEKAAETNCASKRIVEDIDSLNGDVKEIEKIVKLIGDISEHTKLLSLNAEIEAARAGEAGKGFAVVAVEVKKLAQRTNDGLHIIGEIIQNIKNKTEISVSSASNANILIEKQMNTVIEKFESFKSIFGFMEEISSAITEVENSMQEAMVAKTKTLSKVENISAISEETAASFQEVLSSIHEQLSNFNQITRASKALMEMSQELNESITLFKLID